MTNENITSVLTEKRTFAPNTDFINQANLIKKEYERLLWKSGTDFEGFWAELAEKNIFWFKKWEKILEWNEPFSKWFIDGKTNVSYNCLDRHLKDKSNKPALIWIGENKEKRNLTYRELFVEVCKFSNALLKLGVKELDRIVIYMPLIPEAVVAMLACARIGAVHNVVFGGFSKEALADRINDSKAKIVITADGGYRRGQIVPLKTNVDEALKKCSSVEKVIIAQRTKNKIEIKSDRDLWYHELISNLPADNPAKELDSEHPLFILYTSGTTGKPKGILHTTGGYLLWTTITSKWIFDLKDSDVYWCTADIGWITGHSYAVYGPLSCGATVLIYEGAPNYPDWGRFWEIIEENKVNIFYTAPTAIRAFMKTGDEWIKKYDLSSLRLLGSVGEPINPEAWMWYHKNIGKEKCPIVDTWWQTETGGILISPLPGVIVTKPGSATFPLPGIFMSVVDKNGKEVKPDEGGFLVITKPWPAMLRTIYGDDERYKQTYWKRIKNAYFTGDGARKDKEGYFWLLGRVDDVIKVSGHLLSTMEVESSLVSHPFVAEAAVVGYPHDIKGEALCAFVVLKQSANTDHHLFSEELKNHVSKEIGPVAKPDQIKFTESLPKTRSGKIMRRLLRDVASGKQTLGDTTTLEDVSVLEKLRAEEEE
ncbi:MAG: acetate--CoA ligase [Candidatus Melainabacteria bacterium RIFCSPLOWO2_02_FULL_35_15]|nr:MAG: acetate--CoA ligase [Candidatus Melainabacteria bacterium RIFCSPLOWO2_12_FULL_35_11]OGI13177.1 MAG: acetate--CoA ligase [Candidatus Melainabacteria bacterium RIFCSPLOWO2_02_FULL_35_15]